MAKWSEMPVLSKLGIVLGAAIVATAACYFLVFSDLITANKQNDGQTEGGSGGQR